MIEWQPGGAEAARWSVVGVAAMVVGLALFALPSMLQKGRAGVAFQISLLDVLLVLAITAILVVVHEAIHAVVMFMFGARPRFGSVLVGGIMPAVYTTAGGHRFSRGQYVAVGAAPAMVITLLGFLACFAPWAGYLIVPLAVHLGGCVGDGFAAWRVLREPPGTECEDLRDGIRFYRMGT